MCLSHIPWNASATITIKTGAARVDQVMASMAGPCTCAAAALALNKVAGVAEEPAWRAHVGNVGWQGKVKHLSCLTDECAPCLASKIIVPENSSAVK